jgi:hypothetical protein
MTKLKQLAFCLFLGFAATSCNNTGEGSSTPIDSTNLEGTAPATYGPGDPANPDYPVNEGSMDTTLKANTMSSEDSAKMQNR